MACTSCSGGNVAGCKNNGGCQTGGCNKQNAYDWLSDMQIPLDQQFNIVEIRFKGGRKDFFRNSNHLDLNIGDAVVVDLPNGHHIGFVALRGELVRLQMKKKSIEDNEEVRDIYRIATTKDLEKFERNKLREMPTMYKAREIIREEKLEMKLNDVEFQADGSKATFFYSAEDRVDFRVLIKKLAQEFHIRVDMRQISSRQEAGRLGGIGSCGRELCCSTWLNSFRSVSTSAARYQNLSLNPAKLTGQCGRLKCCLNYELDTYVDALKEIPKVEKFVLTSKGKAFLQKTDIFNKMMWFSYAEENTWIPLEADRVSEIIELNKNKVTPFSLQFNEEEMLAEESALNNDLIDLDKKYAKSKNKKSKNRNNRPNKPANKNKQPQKKGAQNRPSQNKQVPNKPAQNKPDANKPGANKQKQIGSQTAEDSNIRVNRPVKKNKGKRNPENRNTPNNKTKNPNNNNRNPENKNTNKPNSDSKKQSSNHNKQKPHNKANNQNRTKPNGNQSSNKGKGGNQNQKNDESK